MVGQQKVDGGLAVGFGTAQTLTVLMLRLFLPIESVYHDLHTQEVCAGRQPHVIAHHGLDVPHLLVESGVGREVLELDHGVLLGVAVGVDEGSHAAAELVGLELVTAESDR